MKMRKWLDSHFVCQIVTLKNVGFSYREIQEKLKTKSKSTVSNAYLRYIPKKPTGRPKSLQKNEKLVTDVLKNPMVSLENVRVHFNSFSAKESISR